MGLEEIIGKKIRINQERLKETLENAFGEDVLKRIISPELPHIQRFEDGKTDAIISAINYVKSQMDKLSNPQIIGSVSRKEPKKPGEERLVSPKKRIFKTGRFEEKVTCYKRILHELESDKGGAKHVLITTLDYPAISLKSEKGSHTSFYCSHCEKRSTPYLLIERIIEFPNTTCDLDGEYLITLECGSECKNQLSFLIYSFPPSQKSPPIQKKEQAPEYII